MRLRITDIEIGTRYRSDLGDLAGLARSIQENGLLQPIVVTPDDKPVVGLSHSYKLVCGLRRLLACQRILDHEYIDARIVNLEDPLGAQIEENTKRKDFTVSERVAIAQVVEQKEKPGAKDRQGARTDLEPSRNFREGDRHDREAKARAAKAVGMSDRTLAKAQEVVDAAWEDPETYGEIQAEMDKTGNVSGAHRKVKMHKRQKEFEKKPMKPLQSKGRFDVILADPPWKFEDGATTPNRTAENQYPLMTLEEIKALPVQEIAGQDSVLFIWAPNSKTVEVVEVIEAWGFEYKTNFAWVKDRIGLGNYNRQKHELLHFAVRGAPGTPPPKSRHESAVESPREEHSKKPDIFYDIIEAMYPWASRIELFARAQRLRWEVWGYEAPGG